MFDIKKIRDQFPITRQKFPVLSSDVPKPLIYFDHGASTHAPHPVLEVYNEFMEHSYSNVHRGHHFLSQLSTDLFEHVSTIIYDFIGATPAGNCIVLAGNTTGALDIASHLMAHVDGATLVTRMEHHSNDLPHRRRGEVIHVEVLNDGTLDYADLEKKLRDHKIKLVAITGASNVTGWMPDLPRIATLAHAHGAKILVDAAQLLAHRAINVFPNSAPAHIDFLAAAGHKAYAPFGSAFLFGPEDIMNAAPPYIPGGGTVVFVGDDDVFFDKAPDRHQGGTPNIAGAIAMAASLHFLKSIGMRAIREHEIEMTEFALDGLLHLDGVQLLGNPDPAQRLGVAAFTIDGMKHDLVSTILNREAAIATRNGCFCAHPYILRLLRVKNAADIRARLVADVQVDIPGAVRATFGLYNTMDEVAELLRMVRRIRDGNWIGNYGEAVKEPGCDNVLLKTIDAM